MSDTRALEAQVAALQRELTEAKAEIVHVTELRVVPGAAKAQFEGIGVQAFALLIAEFFIQAKGKNYVEWQADMTGTFTTPEFVLTCQKRTGKTPDELRRAAESAREAAEAQVARLTETLREIAHGLVGADGMYWGDHEAAKDALLEARAALAPGQPETGEK